MAAVFLAFLPAVPATRLMHGARAHGLLRSLNSPRLRTSAIRCAADPDGVDSDNIASSVGEFRQGGRLFTNPLPQPTGKRVDEIVDFPTRLQFKIVGVADDTFVADIEQICTVSAGYKVTATSLRDKGKYTSITVDLRIDSAQVFYRLYEDIGKDARVKFMI